MKKKSDKRRLFEVVGALDKTFKPKLHENRQTLNERDWQYTINITQPWEAYEEQEDVAAFRVSILDILRNASEEVDAKFGEDVSYELETNIIDEFEMGEDVEDMDYALRELFDWADENNIWIEKMDAGTPAPQPAPQQNVDNSQWKGMSMNEKNIEAVNIGEEVNFPSPEEYVGIVEKVKQAIDTLFNEEHYEVIDTLYKLLVDRKRPVVAEDEQTGGGVKFRAEVTGKGENRWSGNAMEYDTEEEAKQWLDNLASRWFGFDMSRVVPVSMPTGQPLDMENDIIYQNLRG